jgi:DNA-directed RNA polymerase I subunit RPA1
MYLNPIEVRDYMRKLWRKEKELLDLLFGSIIVNQVTLKKQEKGYKIMSNNYTMFFIEVVVVTPNRFRPENKLDD